jgi:hypothetical protein
VKENHTIIIMKTPTNNTAKNKPSTYLKKHNTHAKSKPRNSENQGPQVFQCNRNKANIINLGL